MTAYRLGRLGTTALLVLATMGTATPDPTESVRVRLFADQAVTRVDVSDAGGGGVTIYDSSGALASLEEGQTLQVDIWNEFLRARWSAGSVPLDHAYVKSRSGTINLTIGKESRSYRGSIELVLDADIESPRILVINEVALADYVTSVLPSEYGFVEPEGVKAQAIVIRTYALSARSQNQPLFDLTDDVGSQVYMGLSSETDVARAAVEATSNMTITHDGQLIEAVYSAHCGGHSANNEDVWNSKPVPYLRGRSDPYDESAPVARWESRIKKKDLLDLLSQTYHTKVRDISIADRGSGKRATEIKLDTDDADIQIRAQHFRVVVNGRFGGSAMKSTMFDVKKDGDSYRFSGKGLGHGVGLCQWGAAEQAREGRNFKDILAFYYRDVKIEGYKSDGRVARVPLADATGVTEPTPTAESVVAKDEPKVETKPRVPKRSERETASRKRAGRRVGW